MWDIEALMKYKYMKFFLIELMCYRNHFMIRGEHLVHSVFSGSVPLVVQFRLLVYPMMTYIRMSASFHSVYSIGSSQI